MRRVERCIPSRTCAVDAHRDHEVMLLAVALHRASCVALYAIIISFHSHVDTCFEKYVAMHDADDVGDEWRCDKMRHEKERYMKPARGERDAASELK